MIFLAQNYNPAALSGVMYRALLSVAPDGRLYDCDFNQPLNLPLSDSFPSAAIDFDYALLAHRRIATGPHRYSCMGVLAI
jgi:hypothetical protein